MSSACASGMRASSSDRSSGVRTPETTSSPWAFERKSPLGSGAPVTSSREKATPEHELSPLFPNTICWTFTAVPHSSGMRLIRRYSTARSPVQESNTARMASRSCCPRVLGERVVVERLERLHERAQVVRRQLGVQLHPGAPLPLGDRVLEALAGDVADHVSEHLHEAAVRVAGEALVARSRAPGRPPSGR